MRDPKQRFSSRVENYIKYRPSYPPEIIATLEAECGLSPRSVIGDIGSGTGLLSRLFLDLGCRVIGVEPNAEMRSAGARLLADSPNFTSQNGSAEETGLPDGSVDFITAGQAFHWFNLPAARKEFERVLVPGGWVALVWNERQIDTTPFLKGYEDILKTYGTDYEQTQHRHFDEGVIRDFFGNDSLRIKTFSNAQYFDMDGMIGRVLSSSYVPESGHPNYEPMVDALRRLYNEQQEDGQVAFLYDTQLYYGRL